MHVGLTEHTRLGVGLPMRTADRGLRGGVAAAAVPFELHRGLDHQSILVKLGLLRPLALAVDGLPVAGCRCSLALRARKQRELRAVEGQAGRRGGVRGPSLAFVEALQVHLGTRHTAQRGTCRLRGARPRGRARPYPARPSTDLPMQICPYPGT